MIDLRKERERVVFENESKLLGLECWNSASFLANLLNVSTSEIVKTMLEYISSQPFMDEVKNRYLY